MKAMPRTSPKAGLFLLLIVAAGLTLIVANHARTAHKGAAYTPVHDEQIVIDDMADAIVKLMKGRNQRIMTSAEIVRAYGVDERTARRWRSK